jgi:catechol-2,3-dioxygenase
VALEVESLEALRTVCAEAKSRGISPSTALNHRVSISVYFHDPEGNMVEVFWATGRQDRDRPYADPISLEDLERPESELLDVAANSA